MSYDLEYGEFRDKPLAYLRQNEPDYSDAQYLIKRWPKAFATVPYTAHSRQYDYGGPTSESNYRVWKDDFGKTENKTWWDLGDNGILVRIDIAPTDQKEAIDSLEGYPILSESDESELTQEIQDENWNDYGLKDTRDDLLKRADPEIHDKVETLFDAMPDKIFANAYWEQSSRGNGPEQDGGGYGTVFPRAFEDWDGLSFSDLLKWLDLEEAIVRVRLSDAAFTSWIPTKRPGEKERTLRITKAELEQSVGEMKLSKGQLAKLIRDEEIRVELDEDFPCENLYVECTYPWETENEDEEPEAKENPAAPPKALADKAVAAMRVYLGSVGRVAYRDEQKLYSRTRKAVEKMAQGTGAGWNDWWSSVEDAARAEGLQLAMPGKDI